MTQNARNVPPHFRRFRKMCLYTWKTWTCRTWLCNCWYLFPLEIYDIIKYVNKVTVELYTWLETHLKFSLKTRCFNKTGYNSLFGFDNRRLYQLEYIFVKFYSCVTLSYSLTVVSIVTNQSNFMEIFRGNFKTGIRTLVKISCRNIEMVVTVIITHFLNNWTDEGDMNFVEERRPSLTGV